MRLWLICVATSFLQVAASCPANYDDDDSLVLLALKSVTLTEADSEAHHQAAEEVREEVLNLVSADLRELDHSPEGKVDTQKAPPLTTTLTAALPTPDRNAEVRDQALKLVSADLMELGQLLQQQAPPMNSTFNSTHTGVLQTRGISDWWLLSLVAVASTAGVFIVACFCTSCCSDRRREKQKLIEESDVVEVWKKMKGEDPKIRLTALFNKLDEILQDDDSPPGFITLQDLQDAQKDPALARELKHLGISDADCSAVFMMLDTAHHSGDAESKRRRGMMHDAPGLVGIDEFVNGCLTQGVLPPPSRKERTFSLNPGEIYLN